MIIAHTFHWKYIIALIHCICKAKIIIATRAVTMPYKYTAYSLTFTVSHPCMTLFSTEMNEEAENTMREAISIIPDHPQFHFSLGVLLGRLNRLEVCIISCGSLFGQGIAAAVLLSMHNIIVSTLQNCSRIIPVESSLLHFMYQWPCNLIHVQCRELTFYYATYST